MKRIKNKYWIIFFSFIIFTSSNLFSQVINNSGAVISISNSTVINADSIINDNAASVINHGTTNVISLNNAGAIQGNGTYNISKLFSNTGTFTSGTSTVNYNGSLTQTILPLNYYNLTISNARTSNNITFSNAGTIGIAGSFSPNATFTSGSNIIAGTNFNFNGSGAQSIPAFTFEQVNFSGGNTKTLAGHLTLKNSLAISDNTTLALANYNITLQSNVTATARIATSASTAVVTYGSGRFISERYIPGRRKFRLLTSPVTTSPNATLTNGEEALSIWGNWQNQGNNATANIGAIITGGASGDGFDQQTSTASMYTYDDVNRRYVGYSTTNGKNTKYTPLKAGIPYYFFVYGDRQNGISTNAPNVTVLNARGTILTGDQSYTINSTIPLANVVDRYTFLGNPFASPIDWTTLPKTNLYDTYWGWDPNLSATGGYVTVNSSEGVTLIAPFSGSVGLNQYIQSGQGFFVRTSATNPTLTIREIDKVSNYNVNAFRGTNDLTLVAVNLLFKKDGLTILTDGALAAFSISFNNSIGKEDAEKIFNNAEGVAILNQSKLLSIDAKKLPNINDSIQLYTSNLTKVQYTLQVYIQNIDTSILQPYLEDKYLNTLQQLSIIDTNFFNFATDQNIALSKATNRFKIIFKAAGSLPGTVTMIKATPNSNKVVLNWTVYNNTGVEKYEVLKSSDGVHFKNLSYKTINSSITNNNYQIIDETPVNGLNYYQIKTNALNGIQQLSKIAIANIEEQKATIKIYPNPIKGKHFNIQLTNLSAGAYIVNIYNTLGKLIGNQIIQHQESQLNHTINLQNNLSSGTYIIRLENNKTKLSEMVVVEN